MIIKAVLVYLLIFLNSSIPQKRYPDYPKEKSLKKTSNIHKIKKANRNLENSSKNNGENFKEESPVDTDQLEEIEGKIFDKGRCQPEMMRAFGLNINSLRKPRKINEITSKYCPWNFMTCCIDEDFKAIKKFFLKSLKRLNNEMYMVQHLLTLFNGRQDMIAFEKMRAETRCHGYLEEVEDEKGNKYYTKKGESGVYNMFEPEFRKEQMMVAFILKEDVKAHYNKIKTLFASMTCTICSPYGYKFIELNDNGSKIVINYITLEALMEIMDFEIRLTKFLHFYGRPFANLARCALNIIDRVDYSIEKIDIEEVVDFERHVYYCGKEASYYLEDCNKIMDWTPYGRKGRFNYPMLVKQCLKVLFKLFYQIDVESFYMEYFKVGFNINQEVYTNFYDKNNDERKKYKLGKAKIVMKQEGIDLVQFDIDLDFFKSVKESKMMKVSGFVFVLMLMVRF